MFGRVLNISLQYIDKRRIDPLEIPKVLLTLFQFMMALSLNKQCYFLSSFLGGFTGPLNIYRNLFTMETFKFKPKFYDMPTLIVWGSADNFL